MAQGGKQDEPGSRRNWPAAIGHVGDFPALFARAGFRDPNLVLRWAEIVGPEVARFTAPLKFSEGPSGGVLTLRAEPAAAVFLQHQSRMLCERINTWFGRPAVARLRFSPGPVPGGRTLSENSRQPRPAPENDPARRFVGPDPLKVALLNLARARQRPAGD